MIALLAQLWAGAYFTDRGQTADEAAHFVTSLMLTDYLRHLGTNPIEFAKLYYEHFPKVAIGHWPPFFEVLQSIVFAMFGGSDDVAMVLQALIAGLLAGIPAVIVGRRHGTIQGACTGLAIICSPYILFLIDTDMADNLLGVLIFLSTCAWSVFYITRVEGGRRPHSP